MSITAPQRKPLKDIKNLDKPIHEYKVHCKIKKNISLFCVACGQEIEFAENYHAGSAYGWICHTGSCANKLEAERNG